MNEQATGTASVGSITVIVNGREKKVPDRLVTFEEAVRLAYDPPPKGDVMFTVTFRNGDRPHDGSLVAGGERVLVKLSGTIFDVQHSNKS